MAKKTALASMNDAIEKILAEYADDVQNNVAAIAEEMGKKGVTALRKKTREVIPVDASRKTTGDYAKGWKVDVNRGRLGTTVTIYNEKKPGLTHLLEHGHVTRNGTKRTYPDTPAHEHIKPVADELVSTFQKKVVDRL